MVGEKGQKTLIHYTDTELDQKGVELYALAKMIKEQNDLGGRLLAYAHKLLK